MASPLFIASMWSAVKQVSVCLNCSSGLSMVCEVSLSTRSSKCSGSSALVFCTGDGSLSPKMILGTCVSSACEGPGRAEQLGTRSPSLNDLTGA